MKRLNFNIKDRKALTLGLCLVAVCVFTLTIAYAALSVTLNITGTADISAATWDVHLDNVQVKSGSVSGTAPTITGGTTATFSTSLTTPGDFYEFTIDVVNNGTIDAMIDGVSKTPTLTTAQAKYLNYIVEYQNGESINNKQLVVKDSFVRLKVRVEFRKDLTASDLPTTSESLTLSFTVNYVQSDGTEESVLDNGVMKAKVVSGDYDTIGSEICIKEECFYVISSTEETVTMLSKMNITLDGNPIQSSSAGTLAFSNTNYWSSTVSSYPAYVYDSNSTLYGYIENYKTYISTLGVTPSEARLITYDELSNSDTLACATGKSGCRASPYSWIYSIDYWTGSADNANDVFFVNTSGSFGGDDYNRDDGFGVRPVIVISKSLF